MNFAAPGLRSAGVLWIASLLCTMATAADSHAARHALGGPQHARVAVAVFVATDCAISNRYAPEIQRLEREFGERAPLWVVYPNATETAQGIREHESAYRLAESGPSGGVRVLTGLDLVRLTGAKVTPSAAVLVRDGAAWRPVYLGRIDDHFLSIGQERTQTQHHDLEDAVAAALAGRTPAAPGGPAVGCGIMEHK